MYGALEHTVPVCCHDSSNIKYPLQKPYKLELTNLTVKPKILNTERDHPISAVSHSNIVWIDLYQMSRTEVLYSIA